MSKRLIYAEDAIEALHDEIVRRRIDEYTNDDGALDEFDTEAILRRLPSAQPTNIQDILEYLDLVLHPIVSPEHWNIYSELYDMISALSYTQPEFVRCKDCKYYSKLITGVALCNLDGEPVRAVSEDDFCSKGESIELVNGPSKLENGR